MKRYFCALLALMLLLPVVSALAEGSPTLYNIRHGDTSRKWVAISIDDCFSPEMVEEAFEISKEYDVPFTFFILGINLEKPTADANMWREIASSKCEIGNHSYGHIDLLKCDRPQLYAQIMRPQAILDKLLGYHYPLQVFRPPYGHYDKRLRNQLEALGIDNAVMWNVSQINPEKCMEDVQNGSILLFHDNRKDIDCIRTIVPQLLQQGYELVTISEMLGKEPVATSTDLYEYVYYKDWQKTQK